MHPIHEPGVYVQKNTKKNKLNPDFDTITLTPDWVDTCD